MEKSLSHPGESRTKAVETFFDSLEDLHVKAYFLRNQDESVAVLRDILLREKCGSVLVAGIPPRFKEFVLRAVSGLKCTIVEDLNRNTATEVLSTADAGITWIAFGLSHEGALLEITYDNVTKMASSLPLVHLALLESSSILPDLLQAMPEVGRIISESPVNKKPTISFISGPSKTGDIEMRLLYGVHGPHSVYALVLDW